MTEKARSIQIYADGANLDEIRRLNEDPRISGFTTNPTLMRAAGVTDYLAFAREVAALVAPKPVSLEVFADDREGMAEQARLLASLGENVFVKIPVTNTAGVPSAPLVADLLADGVRVNVTAVFTLEQIRALKPALENHTPAIVSVFAGRIADTGRDPIPIVREAVEVLADCDNVQVLWASPREILNVVHAEAAGCHIITLTPSLLKKLDLFGRSLEEFSLDTVRMFHEDAKKAGYEIRSCVSGALTDPGGVSVRRSP